MHIPKGACIPVVEHPLEHSEVNPQKERSYKCDKCGFALVKAVRIDSPGPIRVK
jgi:hypothetical protein